MIDEEEIPNDELVVGYQFFEVEIEKVSRTSIWVVAKTKEEVAAVESDILQSLYNRDYDIECSPEITCISELKHRPEWKYIPEDHFHIIDEKFFDNPDRAVEILEEQAKERLEKLSRFLNSEIEILGLENKIQKKVFTKIGNVQKQYYLSEQLKAIQEELGEKGDTEDLEVLTKQIKEAGMPKEVEEKAMKDQLKGLGYL